MKLRFIFETHNTEISVAETTFKEFMASWATSNFVWFDPENIAINMRQVLEVREVKDEK